ncbi:MAG: alpha/beta hydrolase [Gammaproteobacteria bacterium]
MVTKIGGKFSARARAQQAAARGFALLSLVILAACQPARVVNALLDDDHYTVSRDLAYGDDPRQRLDLYRPRGAARVPLVVFVYGGNWRKGDKHTYRFVGHALTALGYRVAIPDYRLYPAVTWPAFVEDVARAVAQLTAAGGAAAGAPVILMGHSAGAHTAALLATDPRYLDDAGSDAPLVGFVGLAGPYELPFTDNTRPVFAPLEEPGPVQPLALEVARMPRTLLLHGAADERVVPRQSRRFAAALEAAYVAVQLVTYDDVGHVALVASLAANLRWVAPSFADVERFLVEDAPAAP